MDPSRPGELRPIFETSTIQLVFSEPLAPRSVVVVAIPVADDDYAFHFDDDDPNDPDDADLDYTGIDLDLLFIVTIPL